MSQRAWLRCEVTPGMFSNEYAVTIRTADDFPMSLFVPEECLRDATLGEGQLRVDVLDSDDNFSLVSLPRPSFERGSVAKVPRLAVTAA